MHGYVYVVYMLIIYLKKQKKTHDNDFFVTNDLGSYRL